MKKIILIILLLGLTGCSQSLPIGGGVIELPIVEKTKKYIAPERNYNGVQFEKLREQIDWEYNDAHDALSQSYYEETEFVWKGKNYGILDKETFDKMQGKIWAEYEVLFDDENKKQDVKDIIDDAEYNIVCEEYSTDTEERTCIKEVKKSDIAKQKIKDLEKEGIDLKL